jgi:hypothetical protein
MNRIILGLVLFSGVAGCAAWGELATKESVASCQALGSRTMRRLLPWLSP